MREKTDASKLKDGRGIITPDSYAAWKMANEAHSRGTACMLYDPVVGRTVHLLSQAEKKVYYLFRFDPHVDEIFEQFPLNKEIISGICKRCGFRSYASVLSTDLLIRKTDGSFLAVSVKRSRNQFDPTKKSYEKLARRQIVERIYWENHNIPFRILFGDDIDDILAANIQDVMRFYPVDMVTDKISKLKHLLARQVLRVRMDRERIPYALLADDIDVEGLYEAYRTAE